MTDPVGKLRALLDECEALLTVEADQAIGNAARRSVARAQELLRRGRFLVGRSTLLGWLPSRRAKTTRAASQSKREASHSSASY